MVLDPLKEILDPSKLPGKAAEPELPSASPLDGLADPAKSFLNPETGQATAVKPDPAGWPKAEVGPGLQLPEAGAAGPPDLLEQALGGAAPAAPGAETAAPPGLELPEIPGLQAPKPPIQAPGLPPAQMNNPETGQVTQITPDDAGWPKADVSQGLPENPFEDLPGKDLLAGAAPEAPAAPEIPGLDAPAAPELPDLPGAELPGAPEPTQVVGLETGDVTTIVPDDAGWPKASVEPGGLPELPEGLPKDLPLEPPSEVEGPDLLQKLKDQI